VSPDIGRRATYTQFPPPIHNSAQLYTIPVSYAQFPVSYTQFAPGYTQFGRPAAIRRAVCSVCSIPKNWVHTPRNAVYTA